MKRPQPKERAKVKNAGALRKKAKLARNRFTQTAKEKTTSELPRPRKRKWRHRPKERFLWMKRRMTPYRVSDHAGIILHLIIPFNIFPLCTYNFSIMNGWIELKWLKLICTIIYYSDKEDTPPAKVTRRIESTDSEKSTAVTSKEQNQVRKEGLLKRLDYNSYCFNIPCFEYIIP